MRKLKLDLDALAVEAFETVNAPAAEGTVMGHAGFAPRRPAAAGSGYAGPAQKRVDPGSDGFQ